MRPSDFLEVLDQPDAPALRERDAAAELLLTLIAHLFFADRRLEEGEVVLMKRLAADVADVEQYLKDLSKRELDLDKLAEFFPDPKDRDDIITLAEHAVWGDDDVDAKEWDLVDELVEKLGVLRD